MREIKFRVWNIAREVMDTPYFFEQNPNGRYSYYEDWRDLEDGRSQDCELMQFTGLKDRTGKDIYEGDVLATRYGRMTVVFRSGMFKASKPAMSVSLCTVQTKGKGDESQESEIIGNIYSNPELTK